MILPSRPKYSAKWWSVLLLPLLWLLFASPPLSLANLHKSRPIHPRQAVVQIVPRGGGCNSNKHSKRHTSSSPSATSMAPPLSSSTMTSGTFHSRGGGGGNGFVVRSARANSRVAATIGNVCNTLSIGLVVLLLYYFFQVSAKKASNPDCSSAPFDPQWWKDGFCVKNPTSLFTNTHAFCCYIDLTLTWILRRLMQQHQEQIDALGLQNEYLNPWMPWSTVIHGVAHFFLPILERIYPPGQTPTPLQYVINFIVYFAVFGSLYVASNPKFEFLDRSHPTTILKLRSLDAVAVALAFASALLMNTKPFFTVQASFTGVQTLTITYAALIQLFFYPATEKGFAYAAFAGIVTLIVNITAWVIALHCTKPTLFGTNINLLDLFGHVWFDGYLATSYIIFLLVAITYMKPPPPASLSDALQRAATTVAKVATAGKKQFEK